MTTAMPRKRKHAASASITTLDDGTNVVTPSPFKPSNNREVTDQRARRVRKRVNTAASEEAPAAHTDGMACPINHLYLHNCSLLSPTGSADTSQPRPGLPHQSSSDESVRIIPPECCYHCLTRGGNAAYQCAKADGEERCSRCVRDKRTTCRLPTSEEAVQIAARCPRCTMRGFKNCDGGTPCDTCIRNKTPASCRSTSRKVTKKNPDSSEPSLATGTANTRPSTSRKPRQESLITSQTTESKKTATSNGHIRPKNIRRSGRLDAKEATEKSRVHGEDYTPSTHRDTILESDIQDLILREEDAGCSSANVSPALLTSPETRMEVAQSSLPKPAARRLKARQLNLSYRPATRHTVGVSPSATQDFVRPSSRVAFTEPSTESTSFAQQTLSNTHINLTRTGDGGDLNISQSIIRPRRSRSRVSYAEVFDDIDIDLDMERSNEDDSGTDIFTAPTTDEEIDEYDETENTSEDGGDEHHMSVDGDEYPIEDLLTEDDETMERLTESSRQNKTRATSQQKAGKGIDLSLPPLSNIQDCFTDLAAKGVLLGLGEALENLGATQIRLATIQPQCCFANIVVALVEAKHSGIHFQHEFSAEIEPVKQGYIERNFQPKILFRDVRDFIRESATTATTAYGAEVEIPTNIHILVAGFVCKDLSRLNNKNKGLEDGGESGDTWLAIYTYAKRFRPNIVLLENVKSTKEMWHDVVRRWDNIGYEATWLILDTKNYYLPQTRERMYMIAIERSKISPRVKDATDKWRHIMEKLRRQCSSPYEAFIADSLQEPNTYSTPLSEPDWALCKLRYDHIRSKQKLGILSPVTQSSGSGTVRREYFESQSSRVWDAIDVAHLQSAREGSDSLYKMAVWDVSQNVDRFKADRGILPCITPGGSDFASNRQQALSGGQLLLLQGMPLNRLIFANETQRDRQDLAGNAMSTTVIGASLIAAITSCWSSFLSPNPPIPDTLDVKNIQKAKANWLVDANNLQQSSLTAHEYEGLDLAALRAAATKSARFCHCEGTKSISSSPVQICSACGHTACAACAGNPKHDYHEVIPVSNRSLSPDIFIRSWRPILPPRLKFDTFPDLSKLSASRLKNDSLSVYLHTVHEAQLDAQSFCIGEFTRQVHHWTIKYSSPSSTLELQVGRKPAAMSTTRCFALIGRFICLPASITSYNSKAHSRGVGHGGLG
ncbi:hypothetical protein J1614_011276 [Plenodomus biglobosus]|nr:hypothetical protein J1614_011276 [Plenodomus biglobosus]